MIALDSMFIRNLHDSNDPPSEAEFGAFETEIGVPLPPDYRELLQIRNGGVFYQMMSYPIPKNTFLISELGVGWFTHMFYLGPWQRPLPPKMFADQYNLRFNLDFYKGRIAPKTIPIAESGSTQMFLLDIGDHYGSVFIWDRDEEDEDDPSRNRVLAAPSISDWIEKSRIEVHITEKLPPFQMIQQMDMNGLRGMLDAGLNPNSVNEGGQALLEFSCRKFYYDAAELLLTRKADPNLPNKYMKSPLYLAAATGRIDLVKLLLRHGAEAHLPNQPDKRLVDIVPNLIPRISEILRAAP